MTEPTHARYSGEPCTPEQARENVLSRLEAASQWWAAEEQYLRDDGRATEAEGAHKYVIWVERARRAEAKT